jgi:hypothetical protein
MGRACSEYGIRRRTYRFLVGKFEVKRPLRINGRIVLKRIFKK